MGRLATSSYSQYYAGDSPTSNSLEHVYDGVRHIQNYDGSSAYGEVWHWAGARNGHSAPLRSPNADTASQKGYNISTLSGKSITQRRTWLNPTTEGNKRELFGQGRPMAKDSSGNGANWWVGTKSDPPISGTAVESRFFFEGTVAPTDMSRATDSREAGMVGIFGTSNSYGAGFGRATNEALGVDLNPMYSAYSGYSASGALVLPAIQPALPGPSNLVRSSGNNIGQGVGVHLDLWNTQGLLLAAASGGVGRNCSSCGSSPGSSGGGHHATISGAYTGSTPCGASIDNHCPQAFCTAFVGYKGTKMTCPPWMYDNPYFGYCVRCCCAPCCHSNVNCTDIGDHPFNFCQYMRPSRVNEQDMRRRGMTDAQILLAMCECNGQPTDCRCGDDANICPTGDEGSGQDIGYGGGREGECKCRCAGRVENLWEALRRAYAGIHPKGDASINNCMPILQAAGLGIAKCLQQGLRNLGQGSRTLDHVICRNPLFNLAQCNLCQSKNTGAYVNGIGGNRISFCCNNMKELFGSCECGALATILHELIHIGGCYHTGGTSSFRNFLNFMDCVCQSRLGAPNPFGGLPGSGWTIPGL